MKHVVLALAVAALLSPVAFADDNDGANKSETTVDHSKNPITGSETVTKKTKRSMKHGKAHAKMETTEKTKTMKDGAQEKSTDVHSDSSDK